MRMKVEIASDNGVSLIVAFEALLAGYVGSMPLVWMSAEAEFRDLIYQQPALLDVEKP